MLQGIRGAAVHPWAKGKATRKSRASATANLGGSCDFPPAHGTWEENPGLFLIVE